MIYRIIAIISSIIRILYVPNPFALLKYPYFINYIAEPFLYLMTYTIVGLYYRRGSNPSLGSILYLVFYYIHVGLLMVMSNFDWNRLAITITILAYMGLHYIINKLKQSFLSI